MPLHDEGVIPSLDELWSSAAGSGPVLNRERVARLPDPARRYLEHAIAPGTPPASAVRLRMHGEIKLRRWLPFTAEQVICWNRGIVWNATVRMHGVPITGFDRFIDGEGSMQWKLLSLWPVMTGAGPDITRSAAGRMQAESVWLPSALASEEVQWTGTDASHARARFTIHRYPAALDLAVDDTGRLTTLELGRWGNPDGGAFREVPFGAIAAEERTFQGYTIPTRLSVGWYFGTARFGSEGEFFRASIDEAVYR